MHIVYVSDGKAGHRSQALGLYQAMQRQHAAPTTFQEILIDDLPLLILIKACLTQKCTLVQQAPDYIFAVGSHTHVRVILLGRVFPQAKTVVLMKPALPLSWFDYAIIPEHDAVPASERVVMTRGALNPIVNEQRHQPGRILIALGGSSKRHQWNDAKVLHAIQQITVQHADADIILTTSRRTPSEFLAQLQRQPFAQKMQIFPVEQTPQGWLFEEMQKAEAVWVTEDSVSMIYEALTAGCNVGIIKINRLKSDRITQMIEHLNKSAGRGGLIHLFLNEADRVAQRLLKI